MTDVPSLIDVRDNLEFVRERTDDDDVVDTVDRIEDRLDGFAARDDADRQGVLDEIDNELLRLETLTDGRVEQRVRAARNRVHIYRDARAGAGDAEDVVPVDLSVDPPGGEATLASATPESGEATVELTVVAEDEAERFDVVVAFRDEDGNVVEVVEAGEATVEAGGEETVTLSTTVPRTATDVEAWALAADRRSPAR